MNNIELINYINNYKLNINKIHKHFPFLYFIKSLNLNIFNIDIIKDYLIELVEIYNNFVNSKLINDINLLDYVNNNSINYNINNKLDFIISYIKYLLNKHNDKTKKINNNIDNDSNNKELVILSTNKIIDINYLQNILHLSCKQIISFTLFPIFKEIDIKNILINLLKNYTGTIENVNHKYKRNNKLLFENVYRINISFPLSFLITKEKTIKIADSIDLAINKNIINIFFTVNDLDNIILLNQQYGQLIKVNNINIFNNQNIKQLNYNNFKKIVSHDLIFDNNESIILIMYTLFILCKI